MRRILFAFGSEITRSKGLAILFVSRCDLARSKETIDGVWRVII
jgi:hypothetical protein